jgi:hypothetical protein
MHNYHLILIRTCLKTVFAHTLSFPQAKRVGNPFYSPLAKGVVLNIMKYQF